MKKLSKNVKQENLDCGCIIFTNTKSGAIARVFCKKCMIDYLKSNRGDN